MGTEMQKEFLHTTTLPNEKPVAPYLVGTSETKEQRERLNGWVDDEGSTYREQGGGLLLLRSSSGWVFTVYILPVIWKK